MLVSGYHYRVDVSVMKMNIAVIIPNLNGVDLIAECLKSLQKQTHPAEIIVVDNGSTDDSVSLIEKEFPDITLIKLDKNYGFAGGVNAGIRMALKKNYDAVAVFNNDAVADKNWLKNLVNALSIDNRIGAAGSKQLLPDGKHIDATGNAYTIWGLPFPRGRNQIDKGQYDDQRDIFSAPGGASLYSASMLKDVGLFDERFFAYLEEDDLSFRTRLAGWRIVYEPSARVFHAVSTTSKKLGSFTRFHSTKNFHLLYLKNMPGWLFWKYLPLVALQSFRLALGALMHRQLLTHLRGYFAAVWLIPHALRERGRIQRSRKASISEVDGWLYHGRPPKIPQL